MCRTWQLGVDPILELVRDRALTVIETHHPGRQALWHKDPAVREARVTHQVAAFQQIAETLGTSPGVPVT